MERSSSYGRQSTRMLNLSAERLDALEALPRSDFTGDAWRHMFNDYPPERTNTLGARWNPRGTAAIYVALDKATAVAEGQHAIDVQPRRPFAKRMLYRVAVQVPEVVDLTAAGALQAVGLTRADVKADDFTACAEVGGAVAWLGFGGLVVPSARSAGSNLVIFPDAAEVDLERRDEEVLEERPAGLLGPKPIRRRPAAPLQDGIEEVGR